MLVSLLCDKSNGLQETTDFLLPLLVLLSIRDWTVLDFGMRI